MVREVTPRRGLGLALTRLTAVLALETAAEEATLAALDPPPIDSRVFCRPMLRLWLDVIEDAIPEERRI